MQEHERKLSLKQGNRPQQMKKQEMQKGKLQELHKERRLKLERGRYNRVTLNAYKKESVQLKLRCVNLLEEFQ